MNKELIFVYKADSGLFHTVSDFAHKIFSPDTYPCKLCAVTYGHFSMKQEWKEFIRQLPVPVSFLYQDEFDKQYGIATEYPAAFIRTNGSVQQIISSGEINQITSLSDLKKMVADKLNTNKL